MSYLSIELKSISFFAFHGLYEEERKVGHEFIVDLSVQYDPGKEMIDKIRDTINYVDLFDIVSEEMKQPRNLLETLVMSIANKISSKYPRVREISIRIEKKNPSIVNFAGSVCVSYKKQY